MHVHTQLEAPCPRITEPHPIPQPGPEAVQDGVEGQAVSPAGGEVEHVDVCARGAALAHPAQQDLLTVGLLQVGHDVLHDVFHLRAHTHTHTQTHTRSDQQREHKR